MRFALAVLLGGLVFATPAAAATPAVCTHDTITAKLIAKGKLESGDAELGRVVAQVRCKDLNGDGNRDAFFAVASGGTAGNTNWGAIFGRADGSPGRLAAWRDAYKIAIAVTRGDPEVLNPVYGRDDPNCCPSSFNATRFHWNGQKFKVQSSKRSKTAPKRFQT